MVETRGIKVIRGAMDPDSSAEFYEATWTLTTKKDIYGKGNYNRNYRNTSWGDTLE